MEKCKCGKKLGQGEGIEVLVNPNEKEVMCANCYREYLLGLGRFRELDIRRKRVHLDELETGEWKG